MKMKAVNRKNHYFSIFEKTINHKNSQKLPFGGNNILYNFPNDIALQLLTLHSVNGQFIFLQITWMAIAQTLDQKKIWLEFMFDHSYLCYSSKLWPTTQHTFIPLYFVPYQGKSDNAKNLVRIHFQPLIPQLFFKAVTNYSACLDSTAFCSILRQIGQCWKFGQNSCSTSIKTLKFYGKFETFVRKISEIIFYTTHCIQFTIMRN